jgi:hypothetical protein
MKMTQRRSELAEPALRHTREYWQRLSELRASHPHLPVYELQHFLNHPPSDEPAKPIPEPTPPATMARRIWPYLK